MIEGELSLSAHLSVLKGIGPSRFDAFSSIGLNTIEDVLHYYPRKYLDRTTITSLSKLKTDEEITVIGVIQAAELKKGKRRYYFQAILYDGKGFITLRWFNGARYIKNSLNKGDRIAASGKVEFYNGYQIIHPDFEKLKHSEDPINSGSIIPIYSIPSELREKKIDSRIIRKIIKVIINSLEQVPDHFPKLFCKKNNLIQLDRAIKDIHFANSETELNNAIERLKYDEHFFLQLLMAYRSKALSKKEAKPLIKNGVKDKAIIDNLEFELTNSQKNAFKQLKKTLSLPYPMNCLLQGDVGSGKTIISILASAVAVSNSVQVAIMAPTEILAQQHYRTFQKYLHSARVTCALLTGGMPKKDRDKIIRGLLDGKIDAVIGTHALIQKDIFFNTLGLVIIDEQHRFGVKQRSSLLAKGSNPHFLAMTATPIPRTLAITLHGDMDLCIIDEMPINRKPITTKVVSEDRLTRVYDFIKKEVQSGKQCMIVYPLIEETEKSDLIAAKEMYNDLSAKQFSTLNVGLIHGKMSKIDKDQIMYDFSNNKISVLISTTVIEVGIDVPNSTIMLIEHAERFGLTQLHQLRGRVGRGSDKSYCILVRRNFSENSKKRLQIMENTNNGFKIADEDLKIRGPGEFFGIRQSGFLNFKIADMTKDGSIIYKARKAAIDLILSDPALMNSENILLKNKLYRDYKERINEINIS